MEILEGTTVPYKLTTKFNKTCIHTSELWSDLNYAMLPRILVTEHKHVQK